ncbi:MAG: class III extradiol ring-cleavage dioxygenase [Burkholderiales bacterium]
MHRLPTLFVSHGAPTFALSPGLAGPRLTALGRALTQALPRPAAVLVVSPHWQTAAPRVSTAARPTTLHDFGGFPQALFEIDYPAPGHPQLAQHTIERLRQAGWPADADAARGLDHGAWVPLLYLYPQADVPVFQVSLPAGLDAEAAWQLGLALAPLADDGVLIVGSGSLTHNLHEIRAEGARMETYAAEFSAWVGDAATGSDRGRLKRTLVLAPHAQRAHPTPEHFWPLLVAAGAADPAQPGWVIEGGTTHGVLNMDSFVFGALPQQAR